MALLVVRGSGTQLGQVAADTIPGLPQRFCAAFIWAGYSVMSRRLKAVPTDAVAGFCLATAVLAALCHLMLETTVWPQTRLQWICIVALGSARWGRRSTPGISV